MSLRITAVRHGTVDGMETKRFHGLLDSPLNRFGQLEAEATANFLASFCRPPVIYTSPLMRCRQTAEAIATAFETTWKELPALTDIDYGAWQNRTFCEVAACYPEQFRTWLSTPDQMRFPAGESLQDIADRARDAIQFILNRHPDQNVVVMSHTSVLRTLILETLQRPLSQYWQVDLSSCGVSEIDVSDAGSFVPYTNETSHLVRLQTRQPTGAPFSVTTQAPR